MNIQLLFAIDMKICLFFWRLILARNAIVSHSNNTWKRTQAVVLYITCHGPYHDASPCMLFARVLLIFWFSLLKLMIDLDNRSLGF